VSLLVVSATSRGSRRADVGVGVAGGTSGSGWLAPCSSAEIADAPVFGTFGTLGCGGGGGT